MKSMFSAVKPVTVTGHLKLPHQLKTIATTSHTKLAEMSRILGYKVEGNPLHVKEVQPEQLHIDMMHAAARRTTDAGLVLYLEVAAYVAIEKAKKAFYKNKHEAILVEDTCFFVDAMDGQPGPFIKAFATAGLIAGISTLVNNPSKDSPHSRAAYAVTTLSAWDGHSKVPKIWQGAVLGEISSEPRGDNGDSFFKIFMPNGSNQTYAEMTTERRDYYSMRRYALEELQKNPGL